MTASKNNKSKKRMGTTTPSSSPFFISFTAIIPFATVTMALVPSSSSSLLLLLPQVHHQFQDAYAQEHERVIRLLTGSSHRGSTAYVEPAFYIMRTGQVLEFFNTDTVEHRIVMIKTSATGDAGIDDDIDNILFDSGNIPPRGSSSYQLSQSGVYHFECYIYPWMTGEVVATDDIITLARPSQYGFDVQLSWTPSAPQHGQKTYFIIEFIDAGGGGGYRYRQHVDFVLRLENASDGSLIHRYGKHSTYGLEFDQYTFVQEGEVKPELEVYAVDFIPVAPDIIEFDNVVVVPEFHLPVIAAAMGIVVVMLVLRYRPQCSVRCRWWFSDPAGQP